jgi:hypothetical protein
VADCLAVAVKMLKPEFYCQSVIKIPLSNRIAPGKDLTPANYTALNLAVALRRYAQERKLLRRGLVAKHELKASIKPIASGRGG